DFFGRYEEMLGINETVRMSAAEAMAYYSSKQRAKSILREALDILRDESIVRDRILKAREAVALRKVCSLFIPQQIRQSLKQRLSSTNRAHRGGILAEEEKPITPLPPIMIQLYAAKTRVCIDKARRILGYQPAFDFDCGMKLTEEWARWANLLAG